MRKKYGQNLENIDRNTFTFTMTGTGKKSATFMSSHFHNDRSNNYNK